MNGQLAASNNEKFQLRILELFIKLPGTVEHDRRTEQKYSAEFIRVGMKSMTRLKKELLTQGWAVSYQFT